ncbi:SDR family NAD(P)-dependent oxidoreductase [Leptospira sp. GIMC2001]|uniref:SDR family NAD(P)-dependent oxidoreductase n=1 Tax=Leptospira sp. GIMC2001 TaxID=1513297 RepID=UPI00234AD01E|nr:SDR family oxidoreductase [Leptospira sp. GIMC2001]WCL49536.1 SDR family oxidoreductase [Leptospira sp. GIMC2001]
MKDLFSVKGKVILITGASRGIGRFLAEGFRDLGAEVHGTGSKPESVEWMKSAGIVGHAADMRDPLAIGQVIQSVHAKTARIDVLINNAGIAGNTPAGGMKEEEISKIIETNYTGLFRSCQAYYKVQRKSGGNIINFASVLGMIGTPLASVYSGTKGAVISLTKALAIEWVNNGFRVNAICPGLIETDMTSMITDRPAIKEKVQGGIPMGRMGLPIDLMGGVVFLASDSSSYMTGQTIVIDGGMTAQ